jgi:hypothetical protein
LENGNAMKKDGADNRLISLLFQPLAVKGLQISLTLAGLLLVWANLHTALGFDDAFMFYRYALHLREGLGISWNLDGVHTFGETSLLWAAMVWAGSFLPLTPERTLLLASSLSAICAVIAMASAVVLNAKSALLKSLPRTVLLIVLPLSLSEIFLANTRTGMETLLAAGINGLFCGLVLKWSRQPSTQNAWLVGFVALAAFLTRPESALPALLTIGLAMVLLKSKRFPVINAFLSLGILCVGILICLAACKFYFHSTVPLAFYVKGHHFHQGYLGRKQPVRGALHFCGACSAFLVLLIWLTRQKQVRMMLVFLIPLLATTAYLCTLTQIMGHNARYYVPYFAYIIVPAMIMLDEALAEGDGFQIDNPLLRVSLSALLFSVIGGVFPDTVIQHLDDWVEGPRIRYAEARRIEEAKMPLPPVEWTHGWRDFTDDILVELPKGATVAATEVGYVGAMAPHLNVIDLSGLNDTQIAVHGISIPTILQRQPDLIWLPFMDYTYYRGMFFDSTEFLANYTIFDGALTYGIALRKDSPYYSRMMLGMKRLWAKEYSGYPMQDYEVKSASWDRTPVSF